MNIKEYISGTLKQQYKYQSFDPVRINQSWTWDDPVINVLLENATRKLGELNAFSIIVPDIDLFIQMHVVKEANTSSRIEGTKTEIDEALLKAEDVSPEKRDDWQEVQNYIHALNFAIAELKNLPLSNRLLRETHKILLSGSRGASKLPGEFRSSQNWIGGSSLTDAIYIPPHHSDLPDLMSDLERFWHNEEIFVPHLIKAAISHYQFETIHPFLDGNGRIGRLLITLYLVSNGLLIKPSLYLSDFFEKNRSAYFEALSRVREQNDLGHWLKLFLNAVINTADKGKETFSGILKLKNELDATIIALGKRAANAKIIMDSFYRKPVQTIAEITDATLVNERTVRNIINELLAQQIITEETGLKRNKLYHFKKYLNLF